MVQLYIQVQYVVQHWPCRIANAVACGPLPLPARLCAPGCRRHPTPPQSASALPRHASIHLIRTGSTVYTLFAAPHALRVCPSLSECSLSCLLSPHSGLLSSLEEPYACSSNPGPLLRLLLRHRHGVEEGLRSHSPAARPRHSLHALLQAGREAPPAV